MTTVDEPAADPETPAPQMSPSPIGELLILAKATRALVGLKLAELGLHPGQDELLLVLHEAPDRSVSSLADTLCVRPSTVSKMLDRLTERGLVERLNDEVDARRTLVRITAEGARMVGGIQDLHSALNADLTRHRTESDPHAVAEAIRDLTAVVTARLRRFR